METGTTATHVSPGQEEAMRVAETFKRMAGDAADAIVNASKLRLEMDQLRKDFDALKQDMEATRQHNAELNGLLGDVRRQRDEAEHSLSVTKSELETGRRAFDATTRELADKTHRVEALNMDLDQARKERDDFGYKAEELKDALDVANAKLAEIEEFAQRFVKKPEPAKPVDTPSAMLPVTHEEPAAPKPTPRRVYEGEVGFTWRDAHSRDDHGWYNEAN